jgi:6-phosphogluconolactonase
MGKPRDPTRRDFLAASAISLFGLARSGEVPLLPDDPPTNSNLLYIGTYTENTGSQGVYRVRFDSRSGDLRKIGSTNVGPNPSFLAIHPNRHVLYAVNELEQYKGKASGAVSAFAIARDTGALTRLNEQASEGGAPCYVSVDRSGRVVLVANYVGGNIALLPINQNGSLAPAAQVVQHTGTGPNKERQEKAHAHSIVPDPSGTWALSADLGTDHVYVYHVAAADKALHSVGDVMVKPGAGPRHLAFHPKLPFVYVANEVDSTVSRLRFDAEHGKLSLIDAHSTLPPGWKGANDVADIHVASSGRTLYVSNRGHNSIAVFNVDASGALSPSQFASVENWPRNFTLDPTERWLLVAHEKANSILVFARDQHTGKLTPTRERLEIPAPVCLRFLTAK